MDAWKSNETILDEENNNLRNVMLRNEIKVMGRSTNNLHLPASNLTKYKKGAHYMGSKIFNHFPNHIKCLVNGKRVFKNTLQKFLFNNVFYSIDEFLNI
jgi:hypothetical protein